MTVLSPAATGADVLDQVAQAVGADRITLAPPADSSTPGTTTLGPNTSLFRSRGVRGVVRPRTAEEVRRIVELFGRSADSGSLHAYSTGGNWGLGSREPARDGALVLDLSGMDRIREINTDEGWAVVEPGVTQAELAARLQDTDRMINVTVSSARTGVVGNALDRGVGLRHQRVDDLVGLEVALPSGELVHIGWWPRPDRSTPVYPYGLGPSLLQTFVQSDLGIVTAAAIRLLPRPEALKVVRLGFAAENIVAAFDEVRRWVAQGLASGVVKAYNPAAARAYDHTGDDFLLHVCVDGTEESVAAMTRVVVDTAEASGLFTEVSTTDATDPERPNHEVAVRVERAYAGDPDETDALFEAKMGRPADRIDPDGGFLFFLPLVPFTGTDLARAVDFLDQVRTETGIRCGATLNALNADVVDCVVTMKFDRTDADEAARAHRALDRLHELFTAQGFLPYRLDVEHTHYADALAADPGARELGRRIKTALDPHQAIAPGRYA
ncbi:FAD-binding oxidoreductase [Streptomyces sp. Ru71]|uniref:FAD-binding oxidoreductase n=1 Tax=Streptomyces sp. Ru71 TaxID=2080746 RepID=UPI001C67F313|nr:FAD-binding oxidoreductase [Streptomyces sp. Ru71]